MRTNDISISSRAALLTVTAESTTIIAANLVHEFLEMVIHDKPPVGFKSALRRMMPNKGVDGF